MKKKEVVSNKSHYVRVRSVLFDLGQIMAGLNHVPIRKAPVNDKGVYLEKVKNYVESLIKKYEKKR